MERIRAQPPGACCHCVSWTVCVVVGGFVSLAQFLENATFSVSQHISNKTKNRPQDSEQYIVISEVIFYWGCINSFFVVVVVFICQLRVVLTHIQNLSGENVRP